VKPFAVKPFSPKRVRAKAVDREGLEQAALMKEISLRYPAAAKLIFHVPNGGHRHKLGGDQAEEQGVKAGVPDLVLPMARRRVLRPVHRIQGDGAARLHRIPGPRRIPAGADRSGLPGHRLPRALRRH